MSERPVTLTPTEALNLLLLRVDYTDPDTGAHENHILCGRVSPEDLNLCREALIAAKEDPEFQGNDIVVNKASDLRIHELDPSSLFTGEHRNAAVAYSPRAFEDATRVGSGSPTVETVTYTDGTTATGVAPLPEQSPAQQDATADWTGSTAGDSNSPTSGE